MGGFAALAGLLGGAGQAAQQYGQQIRGILEQQREGFANLMQNMAQTETNPDFRSQLWSLAADTLSNVPLHRLMPKAQRVLQGISQANLAGAQAGGFSGGAPVPTTEPARPTPPGWTPGTSAPAAQVDTSPVQPQSVTQPGGALGLPLTPPEPPTYVTPAQFQPAPPAAAAQAVSGGIQPMGSTAPVTAGGTAAPVQSLAEFETRAAQGTLPTPQEVISSLNLPKLRTTQDILNTYAQIPAWRTPAGRAALEPSFRMEVQQNEELRRTQQQLLTDIAVKQAGLRAMMAHRELWDRAPDFYKLDLIAGAYGIREPNFAASWARQQPIVTNADGKDWQNATDVTTGGRPKPGQNGEVTRDLVTGQYLFNPRQAPLITMQGPGGEIARVPAYQQDLSGLPFRPVPPSWNRIIETPMETGRLGLGTAGQLLGGAAPREVAGSFRPGVLGSTRTEIRGITYFDPVTGETKLRLQPVQVGTAPILPGQLRGSPLWSSEAAPAAAPQAPSAPSGAPLGPPHPAAPAPSRPQARAGGGAMEFLKPPTAQLQAMREQAPGVIELADQVLRDLQDESFLGPVRSRWRNFWQHKVGAKDPDFAGLRLDAGLLTTLLAKMHVGLRANQELRHEFDSMVGAGYNDPDNMIEALSHIKRYARQVMNQGPAKFAGPETQQPGAGAAQTPAGATAPGAAGMIHVRLSKNAIVLDRDGKSTVIPAGTPLKIPESQFDPDKHIRIK